MSGYLYTRRSCKTFCRISWVNLRLSDLSRFLLESELRITKDEGALSELTFLLARLFVGLLNLLYSSNRPDTNNKYIIIIKSYEPGISLTETVSKELLFHHQTKS